MPKFEVISSEYVQRRMHHTVTISKAEVVRSLNLEGNAADNWQRHARDYVETVWSTIRKKTRKADTEECSKIDIDSVTPLD